MKILIDNKREALNLKRNEKSFLWVPRNIKLTDQEEFC